MTSVLGLGGGYFHDASACLVVDGTIVAFAEEERFTRRKQNRNFRSCARSASYCLAAAGVRLAEVDEIAIGFDPSWPRGADLTEDHELIREFLDPAFFDGFVPRRLRVVPHHRAHAASAFYCSGFGEAAVLVVDGFGDGASTSIFRGMSDGLELVQEYPFTQSLGWFYESASEHIGLGRWNVGKLMGLAPYGQPRYAFDWIRAGSGGYEIDLSAFGLSPHEVPRDLASVYSYLERVHSTCGAAFSAAGLNRHSVKRSYDHRSGRWHGELSLNSDVVDFAASVQASLEACLLELADGALRSVGSGNLCLAGGVALNCTANGRIRRLDGVSDFFVQPVAGDAGIAIGAALEGSHALGELVVPMERLHDVALGPSYTDQVIAATLRDLNLAHDDCGGDAPRKAAEALAAGQVVGWFSGRMEGGPRALGHRSIIGDPRDTRTRDRINSEIKRREAWRPLAPSILERVASRYIEHSTLAPFMVTAFEATPTCRQAIPATVHVDGSVRPQTVADDGSGFGRLLHAFGELTDVYAVLNTSFNDENEPIVASPIDAIKTFMTTPLDMLVLETHVLTKR